MRQDRSTSIQTYRYVICHIFEQTQSTTPHHIIVGSLRLGRISRAHANVCVNPVPGRCSSKSCLYFCPFSTVGVGKSIALNVNPDEVINSTTLTTANTASIPTDICYTTLSQCLKSVLGDVHQNSLYQCTRKISPPSCFG
jgi:hypothetical protein